jgi:hypothetical protein
VRPGSVIVPQVFGQRPLQVVLVDNQHLVQELSAQVPMILSQIASTCRLAPQAPGLWRDGTPAVGFALYYL